MYFPMKHLVFMELMLNASSVMIDQQTFDNGRILW